LAKVAKVGGAYALTLDPDAIYSLTTTSDQRKGEASSPTAAPFPIPYADDFEEPKIGQYARFFSDQGGVFEVAERPDGGQCLRQTIPGPGIDWPGHRTPEPYTLIGSAQWRNYEVGVDAYIEDSGYASVGGRVSASLQNALPPVGYRLEVTADGKWRLCSHTNLLAQGRVKVNAGEWHNLTLRLSGSRVTGLVDGQEAGSVFDSACRRGMAALGTGWNSARFDNFTIHPIEGPDSPNLALGKTASASSLWDAHYPASAAVDGHASTRWNAQAGKAVDEWLAVDLGAPTRFNSLHIVQFARRITRYRIEAGNDGKWEEVLTGRCAGRDEWAVTFPEVQASQVRLVVLEVEGEPAQNPPSISEFEVYRE